MSSDDPLLSVSQVARMWGTGLNIVVGLVQSKVLPSLDRGELIAQGRLEVPLIRRSWVQCLSLGESSAHRIIEPPEGESVHPVLNVALDVHAALDEGDADALYRLSSQASRQGRDAASLYARWIEFTEGGFPTTSGVASTVYALAPLPAVAVRVVADAPKVPRSVEGPAPVLLLAILPLVEEGGEWKVDLPMFEGPDYLPDVLVSPLPGSESDTAVEAQNDHEDDA